MGEVRGVGENPGREFSNIQGYTCAIFVTLLYFMGNRLPVVATYSIWSKILGKLP